MILWYELLNNVVLMLIIGYLVKILLVILFLRFFWIGLMYFLGILLLIILLINLKFLFGLGLNLI